MHHLPDELTLNGQHFKRTGLLARAHSLSQRSESSWEQALGHFILQWLDEQSFIEVMTSGSTGKPKAIRLPKAAMVTSAGLTGDFFGLKPGNNALLCLRAGYIAGMMMVVRAMVHSMNLIAVAPNSSPLEFLPDSVTVHFAAMLPVQVSNSLASEQLKLKLEAINTIIIGGAPLNQQLEEEIKGSKTNIFATYGMTETITHIAVRRLSGAQRSEYFTALPGINISTDKRGCLVAMADYLGEKPVTTNDLIDFRPPDTFRWLGRFDNIINSGGLKLIPENIEQKIAAFIPQRFFIAGMADDKLGEVPVLVLENSENLRNDYLDALSVKISLLLRKIELPRHIFCTTRFHEGANGKINREKTLKTLI